MNNDVLQYLGIDRTIFDILLSQARKGWGKEHYSRASWPQFFGHGKRLCIFYVDVWKSAPAMFQ